MFNVQQPADGAVRLDKQRLDLHRFIDSSMEETYARASNADGEPLINLTELLGLNMPRGQLVGDGQSPGSPGSSSQAGTPPCSIYQASSRPFTCDDSGFSPTRCGSPVPGISPLDMSTPRKSSSMSMRRRLDSVGTYGPLSPSLSGSPMSQFSSSLPSSAGTPRVMRSSSSSSFSESLEKTLLRNSGSRSDSPESDCSGVSTLDSGNLSELISCLGMNPSMLSHSSSTTGFSNLQNMAGSPEQHELANLTNLHALQSLSNNAATLKYYQRRPEIQANLLSMLQNQSPSGSPVHSPLSSPEKPWSSGSLPGSPVGILPNPPLALAPGTPPSPGLQSPSLDSALVTRSNRNVAGIDVALDVANVFGSTCAWSGDLPPKSLDNPTFSVKVFLGGVPWDINEPMLINAFKHIGPIRVEWPSSKNQSVSQTKGYAYIIFECEKQVKTLLRCCSSKFSNGTVNFYFKISSKRMKGKDVQVIPWLTSDTNWVRSPSQKLDPEKTVFVGGLHGMITAMGLATIMNDLFGGVVYVGIDTDRCRYPIGSGRVTFSNFNSFLRAVKAAFVEIKTSKFNKRVQVDPYLDDSPCSVCRVQQGPYFCRTDMCFRYFCRSCWAWYHSVDLMLSTHLPLMRSSKTSGEIGMSSMGMNMGLMRFRGCPRD